MEPMKRLPDAELEVMKALWQAGENASRADLQKYLTEFNWTPNTVNTYLTRLKEKGFVESRRAGRDNVYTALVSREDYLAFDSRTTLDRLYGTPKNFIAALARGGIKSEEVEQLKALLEKLEEADE